MTSTLEPPLVEDDVKKASDLTTAPASTESGAKTPLARRALPHLSALLIFTLLSIIATWPMFPQLGGYVIDKGDPLYSIWAMAWQAHALATDPLGIFDTNILYPFKGTLAFDEISFAEAVLAAPVYWLSGNPVLSHNLLLLASFALSGYGVWLLVREISGSTLAGYVAGSAFAFSFYRLNHLPHMTLINTQWMPFLLLAAYKLLWTKSWRWAWLFAFFFVLQALSGHYLAFYSAMLVGLWALFYFAIERRSFSWDFFGKLAAGGAMAIVAMLPIAIPYVSFQRAYEFKRSLFEAERFSNTLASFLAVFRGNPLYRELLAPFSDKGFWSIERSAFPGLTVLALSCVAIVFALRQRKAAQVAMPKARMQMRLSTHVGFFVIVALLSAFFSLGPSLQLTYAASNYDPGAVQRIIPLPYALLHEWVPGFQSMRVVSRIGVLVALSLSVLAGFGAYYPLERIRLSNLPKARRKWRAVALATVLVLLPVAESWSAPIHMEPVGTRGAVPPVYSWLAKQPQTVILEYPMTHYKRGDPSVEMANLYQYYSAYHWHHTINGSTTIKPFSYSALVRETEECFPCPRSLDALWAMDVQYVVVHLENLSAPQRTDFLWRSTNPAGKVVGDFIPVVEFGNDRVYSLAPRDIGQLKALIAPGESLLLADPELDPTRNSDELVYGGYIATLAYMLRDRTLFGDARLSFGQQIQPVALDNQPDFALLWANEDPAVAGYRPQERVWANEHVALYSHRGGVASGVTGP